MNNFKERNKKLSRDWKKRCVLFCLITLIVLIILVLVANEHRYTLRQRDEEHIIVFMNRSNICRPNTCCVDTEPGVLNNSCNMKCEYFDTTLFNLSNVLEDVTQNTICTDHLMALQVKDVKFYDNIMASGWIQTTVFSLGALTINSINLIGIRSHSFSGHVFKNLSYLCLQNLNLTSLPGGFFNGIENLKFLYIHDCMFHHIDERAAFGIHETLETLQIHNSHFDYSKLTSVFAFKKLYLADLRYNTWKKISKFSFAGLVNCQSLQLSFNNIKEIEHDAFKNLSALKIISLSNNDLTYLPQDAFDSINIGIKLELIDNPWICSCELIWLQDYVIEKIKDDQNGKKFDVPKCDLPYKELFIDVQFCPEMTTAGSQQPSTEATNGPSETTSSLIETTPQENCPEMDLSSTITAQSTTTTESTTLYTSTSISTERSSTEIAVMPTIILSSTNPPLPEIVSTTEYPISSTCITIYRSLSYFGQNSSFSSIKKETKVVLSATQYYVEFLEQSILKLSINSKFKNNAILWYNVNHNASWRLYAYCKYNLSETFYIYDLRPGERYFICLYTESNEFKFLSPFDCQDFLVPQLEDFIWILNDEKRLIICLFCAYLFIICFIGGIAIYIIMRINPDLLKGSKKVEIVKARNDSDAYRVRRENSNKISIRMSQRNDSNISGIRSLSDGSIKYCSRTNYRVSTVESMSNQLHSSKDVEHNLMDFIEMYEEPFEPPELPPRSYKNSSASTSHDDQF